MVIKSRGPGPPKSMGGWISILTFMFFLFETAFSEGNKIYDMQTLCEDRFRQALYRKIEGAYLKSQNERNLDCIVTFQTHSILQRFMLRFDLLQLDCNDHLFIYDGAHAVDSYKFALFENFKANMHSEQSIEDCFSELLNVISSINKNRQEIKMKRTPKFRFRAAVRTVINNLKWLTAEDVADEELSTKSPKLSIGTKAMLRVPVEERTYEVKKTLFKIMSQLQCFDRYPEKVRGGLAVVAMFAHFPPGRVLVAEGHPSTAVYFFLSGQAKVTKMVYDPKMKIYVAQDVDVINAGFSFGEMNILYEEPWSTTITTTSHVEILSISKENFKLILEEFLEKQQREITDCMNQLSFFKDWSHRSIVECCVLAKITHHKKNEIILGDDFGNSKNSYFIISGSCKVIYLLQVEHIPRGHFTELKIIEPITINEDDIFPASYLLRNLEMPKLKKIEDSVIADGLLTQLVNELPLLKPQVLHTEEKPAVQFVQNHFFQIVELLPGACFGIGESLENKFILSDSRAVTLLCIPRYVLKGRDTNNLWGRIKEMYNSIYPSPRDLFNQFLTDRRWNRSRTKYTDSIIKDERPFTGLTCAEAPYYTRLTTDFENPVFRRIKKIVNENT